MDYRDRAIQARNWLKYQLDTMVPAFASGNKAPSVSDIAVATLSFPTALTLAHQVMVVNKYLEYVGEEVPQNKTEALSHLVYAAEAVGAQLARHLSQISTLLFMLTDEDYVVPVHPEMVQAAADKLADTMDALATCKSRDVVILIEGYDRDEPMYLLHNGKQIGYATYDEHGSSGQEMLCDTAESLAKSLGVELHELNTATEEYATQAAQLGVDLNQYPAFA